MKGNTGEDRIPLYFLAAIIILCLSSPCFADGWGASTSCDYKQYGLDAEKFFLYFTKDTPYALWEPWPGEGKLHGGKGPHGSFLTTYLNPAAYRSITQKKGMVFGSLIVMENYDADKRLVSLTAKIKIKDYNPEAGDWYWFDYAPDGRILAEGKVERCLACHGKMKENDFIMTAPVQ